MLPWSFSEEAAAEKYMAQVQHNMWVTHLRTSVLSIITGGGKWVGITIPMDPLYLSVLVSAEKKFWRCVQSGETPHLINAEPPRPRIEATRGKYIRTAHALELGLKAFLAKHGFSKKKLINGYSHNLDRLY